MTLQAFEKQFRDRIQFQSQHPPQSRSCTDIACLALLLLLLLFYFAFGGYIIHQGTRSYTHNPSLIQSPSHEIRHHLPTFLKIVFGMTVFGGLISLVFFLFARKFSNCILYFSLFGGTLTLGVLALLCWFYRHYVIATISIIALFIHLMKLFCSFRQHFQSASVLIKLGGTFLSTSGKTLTIPVFLSVLGLIFSTFLTVLYASIIELSAQTKYTNEQASVLVSAAGIVHLLFVLLFYYITTFLVSTSILFWFFSTPVTASFVGIRWLVKYHLGSVMFAALVLPLQKLLQFVVDTAESGGCMSRCTNSAVNYCLSSFKYLTHTLNSHSISVMPMMGENFMKSAQTSAMLYYDNPILYKVARLTKSFLLISGIFLCVGLPTIVGVLIAHQNGLGKLGDVIGIVIILCNALTATVYVSTLSSTVSSAFMYFGLDRQLMKYNIRMSHLDEQVKQEYQSLYQEFKRMSRAYDLRQTINTLDSVKYTA